MSDVYVVMQDGFDSGNAVAVFATERAANAFVARRQYPAHYRVTPLSLRTDDGQRSPKSDPTPHVAAETICPRTGLRCAAPAPAHEF